MSDKMRLIAGFLRVVFLVLSVSSIAIASGTLVKDPFGGGSFSGSTYVGANSKIEFLCYFTSQSVRISISSNATAFRGILEVDRVGGGTERKETFGGGISVAISPPERGFYVVRISSAYDRNINLGFGFFFGRELEEDLIYPSILGFVVFFSTSVGLELLLRREPVEDM